MTIKASPPPPETLDSDEDESADASPACVLIFNASDPSGAGGLTADITTVASVGGHPIAVVCGAYARDTAQIFDHFSFDDEAVSDQARAVLEDLPVQAIKIGFVGSPENISAIAEITADYDEIPVIAYMPNLSWWREELIEEYLDAFRELLLPQTSVLVGNHSTLWRWLLPDWTGSRNPTPRDIARAASEMGVPYTLVTGIPLPEQFVENVLASPQTILGSGKFELFDATFSGAGDTLSAAVTALVGAGNDLGEATSEALSYLDRCLDAGFRPGMGHIVPDRMFWAQPDDDEDDEEGEDDAPPAASAPLLDKTQALEGFVMPPHDTKH
ncbi:MAG: bifunctional hydroxymethylpyrimidine kinase/phosphomethylpyrimidine kinase [Acidovorax sp.]|jgi:hydroxymethylpyrimidine/phosphomethylpyrimidine kinase|uniref:bifunctional hydroxymethylpyrimidine kinase/phosphomethylpyrimidine kinase n=1 Tax=Acidovorax sp. TaxID=1872122 RepID=UPI00261179E8|nr:bifunctional hydroxymethylpyrimidine kinase/phosphomethylpyrimidine kinase [Acidovorax sp.]MDH4464787.1 bifunctional hydroxymethylpyrimidine kinase/phosphomethylpyrimidine kinase [Acidovorax sp.]